MKAVQKRIRLAEWITLAITVGCQLLFMTSNSSADPLYIVTFVCLGLAGCLVSYLPPKSDGKVAIGLYIIQGILYTAAMVSGTFKLYGMIFLLLVLKIALLNNTRTVVLMASALYVTHAAAFLVGAQLLKHHAHAIYANNPVFAIVNFIEAQIITASLFTAVILFARASMAEQQSKRKASRLTKEIETMAVAVERGRIVRDVHDGVGHSLTSLNIQLELTAKLLEDDNRKEEAREALQVSRKIANSALADLRKSLKAIKEDDINLADAVSSITQRIKEQGPISFDINIDDKALSTAARHNLLLVVKECLTNIQKHSAASNVEIRLATKFGKAELVVSDNGHGFKSAENAEGLGIKGMNERISSLGGTFKINSDPGKGTRILVSLPI